MTLLDYIRHWLVSVKKFHVKASTYDRLITSLEALQSYPIASKAVSDILPEDCEDYVKEVTSSGYALTTIKKQMLIVSAPLAYAYEHRHIPFNPAACMKPPSKVHVQKAKRQIVAYDKEQQKRLIAVFEKKKYVACDALWFMMETGLRPGEILALSKTDVFLDERKMHIHATMVNLANSKVAYVQEGAKTETSNRYVPLSPKAIEILRPLLFNNKRGFLFCNRNGGRLSYESMRYQCLQICKEAGVPYHGLHVWRHTFATNQFYKGTDVKILSKILGHSETSVTYNIYIHLYGDGFNDMLKVVS